MRITIPVVRVLAALLAQPETEHYGLDLMAVTDLPSGTLYPVLHRLRAAGWLAAEWEPVDPSTVSVDPGAHSGDRCGRATPKPYFRAPATRIVLSWSLRATTVPLTGA